MKDEPRPTRTPRQSKELKRNPSGRRAFLAAATGALLISAAAGVWWSLTRHAATPGSRPDILLITVDTLRADAVGAYGNRRASTPAIDRLAAGGVRFTDAHAQNVTTLPSHANILSGRYPTDHGVR